MSFFFHYTYKSIIIVNFNKAHGTLNTLEMTFYPNLNTPDTPQKTLHPLSTPDTPHNTSEDSTSTLNTWHTSQHLRRLYIHSQHLTHLITPQKTIHPLSTPDTPHNTSEDSTSTLNTSQHLRRLYIHSQHLRRLYTHSQHPRHTHRSQPHPPCKYSRREPFFMSSVMM